MKIVCFGDSNTYGYDPRSYFGGRYGEDCRWVDLSAKSSGYEFVNLGMNGLSIPGSDYERDLYNKLISEHSPDMTVIMLGSNDILQGLSAKAAAAKLRRFITAMNIVKDRVLIVSPPAFRSGLWVESQLQEEQSALLAHEYEILADSLACMYFDSNSLGMELCYDGVHFTARDHMIFSREILKIITSVKEI